MKWLAWSTSFCAGCFLKNHSTSFQVFFTILSSILHWWFRNLRLRHFEDSYIIFLARTIGVHGALIVPGTCSPVYTCPWSGKLLCCLEKISTNEVQGSWWSWPGSQGYNSCWVRSVEVHISVRRWSQAVSGGRTGWLCKAGGCVTQGVGG